MFMRLLILAALIPLALLVSFNISQSKVYQKYILITFCSFEQITSWSCNYCQKLQKPQKIFYLQNNIAQTMAYMWYSKAYDKYFIAFRGTANIENWVEDFAYYQADYTRCKNCKIHEGFYLSYLSLSQEIYQNIDFLQAKYGNKQMIVLGGSLGAAIAMVGGIQIQLKYGIVDQIHTFGSPRVGNEEFAMFLKSRVKSIIRVVHNRDIVPHVPLQTQNFHHPSYEIFFDQQMSKYTICNENGEDPQCSNAFYPNYTVKDHKTYYTVVDFHEICS